MRALSSVSTPSFGKQGRKCEAAAKLLTTTANCYCSGRTQRERERERESVYSVCGVGGVGVSGVRWCPRFAGVDRLFSSALA